MGRTISITVAVTMLALVFVGGAEAHVLTLKRAANVNKFVTREVCESIVEDPVIGTCSDWTSGPCRRVSEHHVRCPFTHTFDQDDGARILCRQVSEWFLTGKSPVLRNRNLKGAATCRQVRPPDPVLP